MSVKTIETMIDWVEINLKEDPSLDKMSEYVGYSSFYCSVKFHEVAGISFKEYVMRRKLTQAARELRESKKRIIDIAFGYGFSSNEAFSRAFHKRYGHSPSSFRKGQQELPFYDKLVLINPTP